MLTFYYLLPYSLQFELYVDDFKLLNKEIFLLKWYILFVGLKKGKVMYANVDTVFLVTSIV